MSETQAEAQWLFATLTADSELGDLAPGGVHEGIAPADTEYPFVTFQFQGGADVVVVGPDRYGSSDLWIVKAVTDGGSFGPVVEVEQRIDAVLQAASGSNVNGHVFAASREAPFRLDDTQDGTKQLGGAYRLLTRRA